MSSPTTTAYSVDTPRSRASPNSIWDIEAAKEAGGRVAAVMTGGAFSRAELEEAGAYAVYEDCAELLDDDFPEGLFPEEVS